jgi:hypothetical protein
MLTRYNILLTFAGAKSRTEGSIAHALGLGRNRSELKKLLAEMLADRTLGVMDKWGSYPQYRVRKLPWQYTALIQVLSNGPSTVYELARAIGCSVGTATKFLGQLVRNKEVVAEKFSTHTTHVIVYFLKGPE